MSERVAHPGLEPGGPTKKNFGLKRPTDCFYSFSPFRPTDFALVMCACFRGQMTLALFCSPSTAYMKHRIANVMLHISDCLITFIVGKLTSSSSAAPAWIQLQVPQAPVVPEPG